MAIQLDSVKSGDLIKAEVVNQFIAELKSQLQSLDERLSLLETAGSSQSNAPVLIGRNPTGDIVVGSRLTLLGRNFLDPWNLNIAIFQSGTQVISINQFLPESTTTSLVFSLPSNQFSELPSNMTVSVSNRNGTSASLPIRVLPLVVIPQGQVGIPPPIVPGGIITVGSSYVYQFSVASETTVPEMYDFSAVYTNVNGATLEAWQNATQISPTGLQRIAPGQPLIVRIMVTIPPGAASVNLALHVRSLNNDAVLTRSSVPVFIKIGQEQEPNDPRTTITLSDALSSNDSNTKNEIIDNLDGAEIHYGLTGRIRVTAHFTVAGRYRYDAQIENAGDLWSIDTSKITPPSNETVGSQQIIIVPVHCQVNSASSEQRFMRIYAYHRNLTDTADDFYSFIRFPIRGFQKPPQ